MVRQAHHERGSTDPGSFLPDFIGTPHNDNPFNQMQIKPFLSTVTTDD
jgi:hypothetical protein